MTELPASSLSELDTRVQKTMLSDRHRLRRSLQSLRQLQQQQKPFDRILDRLQQDLNRSESRYQRRAAQKPKLEFDLALPINERRADLIEAIQKNQVVVICGETGSGKSTQLPKLCLEAGYGIAGVIGHTQPRRIAARSVAARIADELGSRVGDQVGFKIRFTDTTSPLTLVKLMTDGVMLAETQSDRYLDQYEVIIIDEAHERSLNIDFLLGYIKRILPNRPDLKVIITSATIDADRFSKFFTVAEKPAPILEVSGRTYPVEIRYSPPPAEDEDFDYHRAAVDACEELMLEGFGDILVFMPTEWDIREATRIFQGRKLSEGRPVEILPLFGRLSESEQNRVFANHSGRRIVIATNVAESSLTVPGIHYVVDTGTARISRFSAASQVQRLPVEPVSQASANQRAGRCGRIAPGICIRLYSAEDFSQRDAYTAPEIQRTNLASVLLQMMSLKLGRIEDFPFIDPPTPGAVRAGLKTLFELNAINEEDQLTETGKAISKLPVDPRIGRMVLAANQEQCLEEVLIIAAALEQRDPRERPIDKQQAADTAHLRFKHEQSDFLSLLKVWDFFHEQEGNLSNSKFRKMCVTNFLSYNRLREWKDLHRQLRELVQDHGLRTNQRRNDEQAIHRAILSGVLSNIAQKGENFEYTGSGGQKLFLWPGSNAFSTKPKWVIGAELVETSKRYLRIVGPVQTRWIEEAAAHLVKKTYSEPRWSAKQACAIADEKVSLFGLVIVPRRECRYGHIDPVKSRELFIQHGLVEGEYESPGEFFKHNLRLKEEVAELQAKVRQGIQLLGEEAEFDFYDQRIPADVFDGPRFEKWRKATEPQHSKLLYFSREDLLIENDSAPRATAFPDQLRIGTMNIPIEYNLEPGAVNDGVTLIVPPEGLNQLSDDNLNWLIPGLLEEKVAALIKTLPKSLRTLFVPVPETAAEVMKELHYGRGELLSQLSEILRRRSGEYIPITAYDTARLPEHLRFHVKVVDQNEKEIASGRDLGELKTRVNSEKSRVIQNQVDSKWHRDDITSWNFGSLPEQIQFERGGVTVIGFPMLVDQQTSLSLRLSDNKLEAESETKRALLRLFMMSEEKKLAEQIKHFPKIDALTVQALALPEGKTFRSQLTIALASAAFFKQTGLPRNEIDWQNRVKQARGYLGVAVQDFIRILEPTFAEAGKTRKLIAAKHPPALNPLYQELQQQYAELFSAGYLSTTPLGWLQFFPRYLQAMQIRLSKATSGNFLKDRKAQEIFDPHWRRHLELRERLGEEWSHRAPRILYRYLLEEFRVSLFAQQLKTAVPVSEKRLQEVWAETKA